MKSRMEKILKHLILAMIVGSVLFLIAQGFTVTPVYAAQLIKNPKSVQTYVPNEVLVKFKPGVGTQSQQQSLNSLGLQKIRSLDQSGLVHVKLPATATVEQTIAAYQNDPNVEFAQPNYIYHATAFPNDPNYALFQWGLKNIHQNLTSSIFQAGDAVFTSGNPGVDGDDMNMELAWGVTTDCSGAGGSVIVAVVDTGVKYDHEDLLANMWDGGVAHPKHGDDFVSNDNDPMDLNGHGTHVAGTIGAVGDNGKGTAGVCWTAKIMAVRVLDATGSGFTSTIITGIHFAADNGAKVINMSLGGVGSVDPAFSMAIDYAQAHGVVVVVAAGNSGANNDATSFFPCNFTQVNLICVAALNQSYQLASFSNFGATSVDVGAPGTNIVSTWAGTVGQNPLPLTSSSGWTISPIAGSWAFTMLGVGSPPVSVNFLVNPGSYPNAQYGPSTDGRVFQSFNLGTANVALLQGFAAINVVSGDHFRVNYKNTSGDPFASGTNVFDVTGVATFPNLFFQEFDVSGCVGATCSVGFELQSDGSGSDIGVAIADLNIQTLTFNTNSYNTINGTSMATPHVAGLAAMLFAYNPSFTYTEVVNAIKNGGRSLAVLAGKTTTGKAVDAMGSLAFINPPTGLSAVVHPP